MYIKYTSNQKDDREKETVIQPRELMVWRSLALYLVCRPLAT